jgi:hypothetical protein
MIRPKMTVILVLTLLFSAAANAGQLDLSNPEDAVKAMRKLQCNLEDGEPAVYWWTGSAYSRVPGEKDRRLFDYHGMNVRACQTLSDEEHGYGYRQVSREIVIYLDPESGEILRTWTNPWTGKKLQVMHIANDPVNSRFPTYARGPRGPFQLPATTFKNGRGWMSIEVPLFYSNPLGGEYQDYVGGTYQAIEMFNFFFDEAELLDTEVGGLVGANVSWARISKWLPWMEMGDRVGWMMYNGAGQRIRNWDELPELLKEELRANYPEYAEPPPLDDRRPNETSWTYFKKWVDAKRSETETAVQ